MDYKKIIIDSYVGQQTMPYAAYFKQQAKRAERDNFVEFADFFNACKAVVSGWKRNITHWCDIKIQNINDKIHYAEHYIEDNTEWENYVIAQGGVPSEYAKYIREKYRYNRPQIIQELEQEKEGWKYEKHCLEIYLDDYTIKCGEERRNLFDNMPERQYITLKYNALVGIENYILQAEQELTPPSTPALDNGKLEIDEDKLLENYQFWKDIENRNTHKYKDIFRNISQNDFLNMIHSADFSTLNKKGVLQRIAYNICVLSRVLGREWGEKSAKSIGKTFEFCQKRTEFLEHNELKNMYLQ